MYVLCKTPGKKRAFSVQRNLLHEQNDAVTILKGFMDFWHGIWMYVAFSTDFVLDSKKMLYTTISTVKNAQRNDRNLVNLSHCE